MKKCIGQVVLVCCLICGVEALAQKVIVEGGEENALKAQMELYSGWTKDKVLKEQYASFAKREVWSNFSTVQFKDIYEKQLKEMYRVINGELLQVKEWKVQSSFASVAPRPRLVEIQSAMAQIPQLYRVQIKRSLGQGVYVANVSLQKGMPIASVVQFDANGEAYANGTVLEAYLLQAKLASEVAALTRGVIYARSYQCVADEIGQSVHEPTMKEIASEMKKGLKPLVMAPIGEVVCSTCEGTGVDQQKLTAAESAAKREANQMGKRERMYVFGKRTAKSNTLAESKSFTAAKMRRNKPKCQTCKGDGKVPCDIFCLLAK